MADWLPLVQDELYAVIATTLPEIVVPDADTDVRPTLFTSEQASMLSIVEFAKDGIGGYGRPSPPYLFVDIGQAQAVDWGLTTDVQRAPVTFFYLDTDRTGHVTSQEYVSSRLWALKRALDDSNTFTRFQVPEFGSVDTSPSNPLSQRLENVSKVRMCGGMLSYRPGWLVNIG